MVYCHHQSVGYWQILCFVGTCVTAAVTLVMPACRPARVPCTLYYCVQTLLQCYAQTSGALIQLLPQCSDLYLIETLGSNHLCCYWQFDLVLLNDSTIYERYMRPEFCVHVTVPSNNYYLKV